jgi:hypothetical protein
MQRVLGIYPASAATVKPTADGGLAIVVAEGGEIYDNKWAVNNQAALADTNTPPAPAAAGKFDQWSDARTWQEGDRWPTDMEQMFHPQWFKNLPDKQPGAPVPTPGTSNGEYSLGRGAPDASRVVNIPFRSGEYLVQMAEAGEFYARIDVPAGSKFKGAGQIKVASARGTDKLWAAASLASEKGFFFPGQRDALSASLSIGYLVGKEQAGFSNLAPGSTVWLNVNKQNDGDVYVQVVLPPQ